MLHLVVMMRKLLLENVMLLVVLMRVVRNMKRLVLEMKIVRHWMLLVVNKGIVKKCNAIDWEYENSEQINSFWLQK